MFTDEKKAEMFCRYKGITIENFKKNLLDYADEFNAFCAGLKAAVYGC